MINAAVIGTGSMGRNHARIYKSIKNVNLVAVADVDVKTAKEVASQYQVKYYADFREMIEKERLDVVSVVVPTALHSSVAIEVMKKGIHVLLEKPIAISEKDAIDIIRTAKNNKVKLMIGHIERFNPAIIELKKRLEKNELGEIYKIDVQRIGPFPHRISDVGVIIDLSVHDLDIISYVLGSKIKRFSAETQKKLHPKCEDSLTALIRYEDGVLAILNINYLSPKKIREISLFGEKGMFRVNYLTQELRFYQNPSFNVRFESVTEGKEVEIEVDKKEPLLAEIEHFVDCVINDKQPLVTGEAALDVLKIANKLEEQAKN